MFTAALHENSSYDYQQVNEQTSIYPHKGMINNGGVSIDTYCNMDAKAKNGTL